MKNSKLRRALLLLACAVMLVSLSIGATLAYLTSTTNVVENTFTVGSVKIDIWETDTDNDDNTDDNKTIDGVQKDKKNAYKVYPNMTYTKDPTIYIEKGSEDCYVAAKITVTATDFAKLKELVGYGTDNAYLGFNGIVLGGVFNQTYTETTTGTWTNDDIKLIQVPGTNENTFYVIWQDIQEMNTDEDTKLVLFEQIKIPTEWGNDEIAKMAGLDIKVTGYAVQAEGFSATEKNTAAEKALIDAFDVFDTVLN